MSLYLKYMETKDKCKILERLDMNKLEDYNRAVELIKLIDNENFQLPIYIDSKEDEKNKIYFFLWDPINNKLCGIMIIKYIENMDGYTDAITLKILSSRSFKDNSYGKEKIGSILMEALIDEAKNDNRIDFITIESVAFNLNAHEFYKKIGFKFVGSSKRPIMIIKKKPSLNRFLFLDQNYPEQYGHDEFVISLNEIYGTFDRELDKDGKSSILYEENEYKDLITCKNFEKEDFEVLLQYLYSNIKKRKNVDKILNENLIKRLLNKSILEGDFSTFKKILVIAINRLEDNFEKIYLPPFINKTKIVGEMYNLTKYFNKDEIDEFFFDIVPKNIDKLVLIYNVSIDNPYFNIFNELYINRWEAETIQEKLDINMAVVALYFYKNKDIVKKALGKIKNINLKNNLSKNLAL